MNEDNEEQDQQLVDDGELGIPLLNARSLQEQQGRPVRMTFLDFHQIQIQPDRLDQFQNSFSNKMKFKYFLIFCVIVFFIVLCPFYFIFSIFSTIFERNRNSIVYKYDSKRGYYTEKQYDSDIVSWRYIFGTCSYFLFLAALPFVHYVLYNRFGPVQYSKLQIRFYQRMFGSKTFINIPILARLGIYYQITLQHDEALRCFEELDTYPSLPELPSTMIANWRRQAQSLFVLKRYSQSAEIVQKVLDKKHSVLGAGHNKKTRPSTWQKDYHFLGKCHEKNENLQLALEAYQKAWKIFENQGQTNVYDAAKTLTNIGKIYKLQGNQQQAMSTFDEALKIYIAVIGDFPWQPSVADLYTNIAKLKQEMGDIDGAVEYMQFAVNVYLRGGKTNEDKIVKRLLDQISSLSYLLPSSTATSSTTSPATANDNIVTNNDSAEEQQKTTKAAGAPIGSPSIV